MTNIQNNEFAKALLSLLEAQEGLLARLSELDLTAFDCSELSIQFLYPSFRDGEPITADLARFLALRVVSYCLPRTERKRALEEALSAGTDVQAVTELVFRARRLFIKAEEHLARSGEGGEILLYSLIEHFLKAPLVVAKMQLKTNPSMPVHGTDGIHAYFDAKSQRLFLVFGESKIHKSFSSALTSAIDSIHSYVTNEDLLSHEIQVIVDHADLDLLSDQYRKQFLDFLNPYNSNSNKRVRRIACLLGFDHSAFKALTSMTKEQKEEEFRRLCSKDISKKIASIKEKLVSAPLDHTGIHFFLVPYPSVEEFRSLFQKALYG